MDDIQRQFLDIVAQVRTRLELQRALGVNGIETASPGASSPRAVFPEQAQAGKPEALKKPTVAAEAGGPAASKPVAPVKQPGLAALQNEFADCRLCKLSESRSRVVFGEGNPEAVLVFVGEAPGREEDEQGRPCAGAAGQLLTDIIVKGMKLEPADVYICNVMKCRVPDNRKPEPDEIKACEAVLARQIQAIKPGIIVALGNTAAKTLLKTNEGITALRGKWRKYQGIPVMPTFHPAHLLRKESDKRFVWEDIKKVMAEMEKFRKE